ncbi:MAG: hypothetical protein IPP50_09835 [Piscinibacter sp.]|nr:hypothetical protein [Piscinibacter sp.]
MSQSDALGWLAASLMVATFSCREARAMRPLAVATNLAFIGYGVVASLAPVLTLHLLLLPINLWRLAETLRARESFVKLLNLTNRTARYVVLAVCALLAACGGGETPEPEPEGPPLEAVSIEREWEFTLTRGHQSKPEPGEPPVTRSQPGEYLDWKEVGASLYGPPNPAIDPHAEIYTSASGMTYYAYAVAPGADNNFDPLTGTQTRFEQRQVFRKLAADATLSYVVSQTDLFLSDFNTDPPDESDCPYEVTFKEEPVWGRNGIGRMVVIGTQRLPDQVVTHCSRAITAELSFNITARSDEGRTLSWIEGSIDSGGHQGAWNWFLDDGFSGLEDAAFVAVMEGGTAIAGLDATASVHLRKPIVVPVKLADVAVGGLIYVTSTVRTSATNHRHGESSAYAGFRDPGDATGSAFVYAGLEPVSVPPGTVWSEPQDDTPPCAVSDPSRGSVAFELAEYEAMELPGLGARITLVRRGGSSGAVSVQFDTADGDARAGDDYTATSRRVIFADGQTRRTVRVPITLDGTAEYRESLTLKLSDPRGCAALGTQAQATLLILDNDNPLPPVPGFTVGGTVTGLAGSGLVLHDQQQLIDVAVAADGRFEFDRKYRSGQAYEVQVKRAPAAPPQVCTVHWGTGNVAAADVRDIEVRCDPPTPTGGLDTNFGTLGKVAVGLPGGAIAIARQSSGHIVATNGARLVRFHPDGRLDTAFGGGAGHVDNLLSGVGAEVADVTVLPDDRIVVAGRTLQPALSPPYYQMAAARFTADGARDAGFGSGGTVTFRLAGIAENATRVLALPDGRVLLVGQSTVLEGPFNDANNNIAVVRLNLDGSPDPGFGASGAITADAMKRDFALAAALQTDGRLIVAGRTSNNNGDPTDTLFTRILSDGLIEVGFGRNPAYSALDDAAIDIALQADGKIVLLVASKGVNMEIALVRLNPDGSLDAGFGSNGIARSDPGPHDDVPRAVAVQADGRIVVAAQLSAAVGSPDFGLLRFLADGTPDPGFGTAGVLRVDFFGGFDSANDLLVQPDGRIVAAGFARSGLNTDIAMVRLFP